MTTMKHHCAARAMNILIENNLGEMGLDRACVSFAGVEVNRGINRKVPDEGWAPMTSARQRSSRPAVVLEVGCLNLRGSFAPTPGCGWTHPQVKQISPSRSRSNVISRFWRSISRNGMRISEKHESTAILRSQELVRRLRFQVELYWFLFTRSGGGQLNILGQGTSFSMWKIWLFWRPMFGLPWGSTDNLDMPRMLPEKNSSYKNHLGNAG